MIRPGFLSLFHGMAAFDAQTASRSILAETSHQELAGGLGSLQSQLESRYEENPVLGNLYSAIKGYRQAVDASREDDILSSRNALAGAVASLPNPVWRETTFRLHEPALLPDLTRLSYLSDVFVALREVMRHRSYTLSASVEDKHFLMAVVGGLSLFWDRYEEQTGQMIAGKVEEVGAQIQDAGLQALAAAARVVLPSSSSLACIPPVTAPPPSSPPKETAPDSSRPSTSPPPTRPNVALLPFDYGPDTSEELDNKTVEHFLAKVDAKIRNAGVGWPYRFSPWVRTLYFLAGDLPNGTSSKARLNISRGLSRLNELATIDVSDIRRLLGPSSLVVGRPLEGLPADWPKDMSNDFGSAVVVLWDAGQGTDTSPLTHIAATAVEFWETSAGQAKEAEIRGDLKSAVRRVERVLLLGEEPDLARAVADLRKIYRKFSEGERPPTDLPPESSLPQPAAEPRPEKLSEKEWRERAVGFLARERNRWGDPDDDRPLARIIDRVGGALWDGTADSENGRGRRLLTLLFHLTLAYRQLSGVSGEAALVLGKSADTPLNAEDLAAALEEISQASSPRLELLQDAAEEANKDPSSYPSLLGADGLPELVGRYSEYVRNGHADPIGQACLDFVEDHPETGLEAGMARSVLAHFLGIFDEPFDAALLKEITEGLPVAASPAIEIETDVAQEPLFRDADLDRLTLYGRAFFRVTYAHRPVVHSKPKRFMIYVERLSRIYRHYWEEIRQTGHSHFQSAFDKTFASSKYKRLPELADKFKSFERQYRELFSELLQSLGRNPDVREMVHMALLSGETRLVVANERGKLRAAGGPPESSSAPVPEPAEPLHKRSHKPLPEPLRGPLEEELFDRPAVVSPDVGPESDFSNPFVGNAEPEIAPSPTPPIADMTPAKPAAATLPPPASLLPEIESMIEGWGLDGIHRFAITDMSEASGVEAVLQILKTITQKTDDAKRRRDWLEDYAHVVLLKRITLRGKERAIALMGAAETFSLVASLIHVAAAKATGIVLDKIQPEPIQLGRKFGRYVKTFNQREEHPPTALVCPPLHWNEGLYKEDAVMPSGASVLTWRSYDPIDIGVSDGRVIGDFKLIGKILKAGGAIASGKRTAVTMILYASRVTDRAVEFFFRHLPQATLVLWSGSRFSIHQLEKREEGPPRIRKVWYRNEGTRLGENSTEFGIQKGVLPVGFIGETDWNRKTHRGISQPFESPLRSLLDAGEEKLAMSLESSRDLAIYAVGFLRPDHPDAERIIGICKKFNQAELTTEQIRAIQGELDDAVGEIEERFDPPEIRRKRPTPPLSMTTDDSKGDVPVTDTAAIATPVDPAPAPPTIDAVNDALPSEKETDLPWTEEIRNFLDSVWPHELRGTTNIRRMRRPEEFTRKAFTVVRGVHTGQLLSNLRRATENLPDRKLAQALQADLAPPSRGQAAGRIAQFFSRSGDTLPYTAFKELIHFAVRATRAIPEMPPSSRADQPLTSRKDRDHRNGDQQAVPAATAAPEIPLAEDFSHRWAAALGEKEILPVPLDTAIGRFDVILTALEEEISARDWTAEIGGVFQRLSEIYETILEEAVARMDELPAPRLQKAEDFRARLNELELAIEIKREEAQRAIETAKVSGLEEARRRQAVSEANVATDELQSKLAEIEPLLQGIRSAFRDIDGLGSPESLTADAYSKIHKDVQGQMEEIQGMARSLQELKRRLRDRIDQIPSDLIKKADLVDALRTFEDREGEAGRLLDEVDADLNPSLQRLQDMEGRLPLSPPMGIPPPPALSGRRFQIHSNTPREILEVLIRVPENFYVIANSYPELAVLAPDHQVYGRLFRILALKREHGRKGRYVEYREGDSRKAGYAPGSLLDGLREVIMVEDDAGRTREIPKNRIVYALDLDAIDLDSFEDQVRDPKLYHYYKFSYLLSLCGLNAEAARRCMDHFREGHENKWNHVCEIYRNGVIWSIASRDDLYVPMMMRLHQSVSDDLATKVRDSAIKYLKQQAGPLLAGQRSKIVLENPFKRARSHKTGLISEQREAILATYFSNSGFIMEKLPEPVRHLETKLLNGHPIGEVAPDLVGSGTLLEDALAWAVKAGETDPASWTHRLSQAHVLSTPQGSHLLLSPSKIKAASQYLQSRSRLKIMDELTGDPIPLPEKGVGFRLVPAAEIPPGSWHRILLDRLALLAERPSSLLDLVVTIFEKKGGGLEHPWREVVGLVMKDPDKTDLTGDSLRERLAIWIHAEKDRLRRLPQIQRLIPY